MEKKMTAVEWLEAMLMQPYSKEGKLPLAYTISLVKQAKAMERQQIEDAFDEGNPNGFIDKTGSDYFTQTYQQ